MKRFLISLFTIGAVGALAFGATNAFLSDEVTSTDNEVTTGDLVVQLNEEVGKDVVGPSLRGLNMYPGAFVQSAGLIVNAGTISMRPTISLSDARGDTDMAPYIWLQIWTDGVLRYNDWITNAPGYTDGKIVLDTLAPEESVSVSSRMILDEDAPDSMAGKSYIVDSVVTGYQTNNPFVSSTTEVGTSEDYVSEAWSLSVCGVRPSSDLYTFDQPSWAWASPGDEIPDELGETIESVDGSFEVGLDETGYFCRLLE